MLFWCKNTQRDVKSTPIRSSTGPLLVTFQSVWKSKGYTWTIASRPSCQLWWSWAFFFTYFLTLYSLDVGLFMFIHSNDSSGTLTSVFKTAFMSKWLRKWHFYFSLSARLRLLGFGAEAETWPGHPVWAREWQGLGDPRGTKLDESDVGHPAHSILPSLPPSVVSLCYLAKQEQEIPQTGFEQGLMNTLAWESVPLPVY